MEREAFRKAVYGPMSDAEIEKLHDTSQVLRQETARRANEGDHSADSMASPLERIIQDTEAVMQQRQHCSNQK